MTIEDVQKGGLPDPIDERDFKIEAMGALPPVDWSKGSGIPQPDPTDQGTSDACGPHATSKLHNNLNPLPFSIRDLSARVLLPDYGSYARDNIMAIVNGGQDLETNLATPSPETPQNMRDKTGLSADRESFNKELNGFVIPANDIETCAQAINAYRGVLLGVTGSNPGWQDATNPRPPQSGEVQWGHLIFGFDFHMHGGLKCIICSSNWSFATVHHIKEDYFASRNTFNPWVLIPKGQAMIFKKTLNLDNEIGVFVSTNDPSGLPELNTLFGTTLKQNSDGSIPTDIKGHKA